MAIADLHVKYRPQRFEDVIGQAPVVRSLRGLVDAKTFPHAVLFSGPSGVGKTTLARIVATELKIEPLNVIEVDGASNTGIDAMRALNDSLRFVGFAGDGRKMVIVDECHALSTQAWQSLLKAIEEPPNHVYWAFCTTNLDRVPPTIKTRVHRYDLSLLSIDDLRRVVAHVVKVEFQDKVPLDICDLVIRESRGSARQALVFLSMVADFDDAKTAAPLLRSASEAPEAIDLCRMLVSGRGFTWSKSRKLLLALRDIDPEALRLTVVRYVTTSLLNEDKDEGVIRQLAILDAFQGPWLVGEGFAPAALAIGSLLLGDQRA